MNWSCNLMMPFGCSLQQPEGAWIRRRLAMAGRVRLRKAAARQANGFGYDALKRLASVTSSAGTFEYNYDALRQREVTNLTLPNTSYVSNYFDPVENTVPVVSFYGFKK